MKKRPVIAGVLIFVLCAFFSPVFADSHIWLYVDSAPNKYGSPNYPSWESNAFIMASGGTFVNMTNGINSLNVGTTNFEIEDMVVYSFGDLGKRLHFIYWVPGETVSSLTGKNFQISLFYQWDGVSYDFYGEYYGNTWLTPSTWINYDLHNDGQSDGVVGSAGFAWWGAYYTNTPEELAANLADWNRYQGNITFNARMDGTENNIIAHHSPVAEPAVLMLLTVGLIGVLFYRRRFA